MILTFVVGKVGFAGLFHTKKFRISAEFFSLRPKFSLYTEIRTHTFVGTHVENPSGIVEILDRDILPPIGKRLKYLEKMFEEKGLIVFKLHIEATMREIYEGVCKTFGIPSIDMIDDGELAGIVGHSVSFINGCFRKEFPFIFMICSVASLGGRVIPIAIRKKAILGYHDVLTENPIPILLVPSLERLKEIIEGTFRAQIVPNALSEEEI